MTHLPINAGAAGVRAGIRTPFTHERLATCVPDRLPEGIDPSSRSTFRETNLRGACRPLFLAASRVGADAVAIYGRLRVGTLR